MPESFNFDSVASTTGEGLEISKIGSRRLSGRSERETCQNPLILIVHRPPLARVLKGSKNNTFLETNVVTCSKTNFVKP